MPTIPTEGARIQYWRTGSGPAVILVQGAGVIGEGWRPQIDELKERYTAPGRMLSLSLLCTFLKGSQSAAMSVPMIVTALRSRIGTRRMRRHAFVELVMPPAYLATTDRDELCAGLQGLFGRDLADQPPIVMQQVRAMSTFDASTQLGKLSGIPTIVVSAAHDRIAKPQYGRALATAIPGATFTELPGAGHAVTIQCAADVNALLIRHLREASPAGA